MKPFKTGKSFYTSALITFILVFILLGTNQLHSAAALDTTPPTISVTNPTNGQHIKDANMTLTGSVTDDIDSPQSLKIEISLLDSATNTYQSIGIYDTTDQLADTISVVADGTWSFPYTYSEGKQTLKLHVQDTSGNFQDLDFSFVVDLTRPFVSAASQPYEDMTHVDVTNSFVNVVLSDGSNLISQVNVSNPVTISTDTGTVAGTSTFNMEQQTIVFTPSTPFEYKKTYYVSVSPDITDDAGNKVFPRIWKFTTGSDPANSEDPHGNYTGNVNTCINCHSTHVSKGPKLEDPTKYQSQYPKDPQVDNYCMACHDGTVAPLVEGYNKKHIHNFKIDPKDVSQSDSCTGCHNPHLTWNNQNQNLLMDHYIYQHNNTQTTALVDSDEQSCNDCHETSEKLDATGVQYSVFTYRKTLKATGTDDSTICIRCHNGTKTKTNIKSYEEDTNSLHKITATDGSSFNGTIPCSECHDTHGSDNLLTLKDKLGHENPQSFDTGTETAWNAALERQFCQKCHNGSTAVYGVTGKLPDPALSAAHDSTSTEACSTCHGGASNSFIEAAHAPKTAPAP